MAETGEGKRGRPAGRPGLSWRSFFQQTTRPLFVLSATRRLRYVNAAWEALTGQPAEQVRGLVCSRRRHSTALAAALAPTPEALAGRPDRVRRPAPQTRPGTVWWDVSFLPLPAPEGFYGWLGSIDVIGEKAAPVVRKLPVFLAELRARHNQQFQWDWLEGDDIQLELWLTQLRQAAGTEVPLWLIGPTGSGKETTARIVHAASSRRHGAFVAVDCMGLQPYLIESLLFAPGNVLEGGHTGTLYLKSPQVLPRDLQQRLAELCHSRSVSVRWMAGSEQPPLELVQAGQLLPELATALAVWPVPLPPLAARWSCLHRWLELWGNPLGVDEAALAVLQSWPWPRNLRELRQVLREASQHAAGQPLRREHLPLTLRLHAEHASAPTEVTLPSLDTVLQTVEKQMIQLALRLCRHNQTAAAERLGILRNRLLRRMEALGLTASNTQ
ncbi:MAG: sigma 54-interacting transcriptional regulator [Gemmataceae bacterium]|nr:sigma 54-interacting transcriptional regulator [Gemmataceae bacterium]MCS7270301.1 sigma 54-interacting transcriptional regulator [Gemmataceae bacterium]MDW8243047.1 sigma 54-interacting transcriptional regulator [Thermogemmata sp.]